MKSFVEPKSCYTLRHFGSLWHFPEKEKCNHKHLTAYIQLNIIHNFCLSHFCCELPYHQKMWRKRLTINKYNCTGHVDLYIFFHLFIWLIGTVTKIHEIRVIHFHKRCKRLTREKWQKFGETLISFPSFFEECPYVTIT